MSELSLTRLDRELQQGCLDCLFCKAHEKLFLSCVPVCDYGTIFFYMFNTIKGKETKPIWVIKWKLNHFGQYCKILTHSLAYFIDQFALINDLKSWLEKGVRW